MERRSFWSEVLTLQGSVTPVVMRRVFTFGAIGLATSIITASGHFMTGFGVAPHEIVGAILALLLVLRTNAGYDRWYEGRKLWGGIVNQSRNLAVIGMAYGPQDRTWRTQFLKWTAAFPHAARHSLRGERDASDLCDILDQEEIKHLSRSQHLPLYVTMKVAELLQHAVRRCEMDQFAFMQAEQQRASLIDHIGACERILKTPLASVVSIKIRHFIFLYLASLPWAVVDKCGWWTGLLTMVIAYPMLSLDQIGIELENPFSKQRLSHLPLDGIGAAIQENVLALEDPEADDTPAFPSTSTSRGKLEARAAC